MKKFNEMYVIGIDHGYGNMKTANCCFPTGLMKSLLAKITGLKTEKSLDNTY